MSDRAVVAAARTPLPVYAPHQRAQDATADHGLVQGTDRPPHADEGTSRTPLMRFHDAKQHGTRNRGSRPPRGSWSSSSPDDRPTGRDRSLHRSRRGPHRRCQTASPAQRPGVEPGAVRPFRCGRSWGILGEHRRGAFQGPAVQGKVSACLASWWASMGPSRLSGPCTGQWKKRGYAARTSRSSTSCRSRSTSRIPS